MREITDEMFDTIRVKSKPGTDPKLVLLTPVGHLSDRLDPVVFPFFESAITVTSLPRINEGRRKGMKRYFVVLLLLGVVAAFACAGGQSEIHAKSKAASTEAADKAAIANLWENYSKYAMEGNLDAFLGLHDRNAYKMPQDQPMFQPWVVADSLRAAWKKRVETTDLQMSIEPNEIVILGDYAYSMGTYTQVFTPKAGGPQTVFKGKFLDVLHKDSGGTWKILRDCYNSNTPPGK